MTMKTILSVNAGSSSVKVSVYTISELNASPSQIAEAQVSGLTAPPPKLKYTRRGEDVVKSEDAGHVGGQDDAFKLILDTLVDDKQLKEVSSRDDIAAVCHRIVHGGDYSDAQTITADTYHHINNLGDLAPLHNGAALAIVDSCIRQLPRTLNVACFDSQFHTTLPAHVSTYPINQEIARKNRLRKYGFHGISYSFITRSVGEFLGRADGTSSLNVIALHLGSGASACAIRGGRSCDTSMGLTPLAGLPGATRSGSVDPSLVFHYASDVGRLSPESTRDLHISKAEEILNRQSGWRALTGTTDFASVAARDTPERRLAFDLFVDRVSAFVGSYFVSLRGQVDALVFAGGIGERSAALRAAVVGNVSCLGFAVDEDRNGRVDGSGPVVQDVSPGDGARLRVLVCRTDEQFEMARTCSAKEELWG